MVKNLIKYPDPTIRLISANVRFFNDELREWIADMVDTMRAHDLNALSAILIGIQYNIIVIKEGDLYKPYINASLIKHSGMSTQTERSLYYEGISVDVDRFENVTVVYEDEEGDPHHCDMNGDMARVFQQQLDHCYGSTFVDRVDPQMQRRIHEHLEFGLVQNAQGTTCPTLFYRDYIKRGAKYLMGLIGVTAIVPLFGISDFREWTYRIDQYALLLALLLIAGYFFYGPYEARRYKQCTSCQTGNIIGTTVILGIEFLIAAAAVFWWIAPE